MANHPLVLAVRFVVELVAFWAVGYWGWTQHTGVLRGLLVIGLPLLAATSWGVFRVPGYPGDAPVRVPGPVRLLLEAAVFGSAVWALYGAQRPQWGLILGVIVALHYAASYDYILALSRE